MMDQVRDGNPGQCQDAPHSLLSHGNLQTLGDSALYFSQRFSHTFPMRTRKHAFQIHLQPEPEGGFTVSVPALPGCVTYGENYEQALQMAQECIEGFLEALVKAGQPIPEEPAAVPVDTIVEVKLPVQA